MHIDLYGCLFKGVYVFEFVEESNGGWWRHGRWCLSPPVIPQTLTGRKNELVRWW